MYIIYYNNHRLIVSIARRYINSESIFIVQSIFVLNMVLSAHHNSRILFGYMHVKQYSSCTHRMVGTGRIHSTTLRLI